MGQAGGPAPQAMHETARPIEIYLYEPDREDPGFARYAGTRPVGEVFKELKQRLEAEGLLPEEYFCLEYPEPLKPKAEAPFPEFRRLACYAVTGANEGYYVHVDALVPHRDLDPPLLQAVPLFLGKTFQGMDFACRVAASCARHLGA